jgi:zinc protease
LGVKKWNALASVILLPLLVGPGVPGFPLTPGKLRRQTSSFVLPIIKRDSLLNGLQLITLEEPGAGGVSAHIRINAGGLFDLAGKGGLADVTAGMLLKGGGGLSARNVTDTVEQLGLTVAVTADWDSTDIVISGPMESLDGIFDLLGRLLITPSFEQKELDPFKEVRVTALNKEAQDETVAVRRKALEVVFGSYPFGRPVRGTAESIALISRQDLAYFHNRFYLANNSELLISGGATAEQVTRLARSKLGAWKKGEKIPPTFRLLNGPPTRRVVILDRNDELPARASIAQIGVSRRAEDYFAAVIMAEVLGQQASKTTAVHSGTTVESDLEAKLLAGPLIVSIKSTPADMTGDLDGILNAMTQMQTTPPASDAVEAAKVKLIAAVAERLKTSAGAADVILDIETYGLGRDYVIRFADRVNSVSPADVQKAAQNYLKPQSVTIVIAGSASRFESPMKKLGSVVVSK